MTADLAARAATRAGVPDETFAPRHGWANEAWIGDRHVVRISSGRLRGSLSHEAAVVAVVTDQAGDAVPVAATVAHGLVRDLDDGSPSPVHAEWLVSRRLVGDTLASRWRGLAPAHRRDVGRQLGEMLESLHLRVRTDLAPAWWIDAHDRSDAVHNSYRPKVELGPALVDATRDIATSDADRAALDECEAMLRERLVLFERDELVFMHGDVHAHNVLVDGARVTGLLDWEGSHVAPRDQELDMFLRFTCAAHAFPERPGAPCTVDEGDMLELIGHVGDTYPALFAGDDLLERLEVYDAHWQLISILATDRLREDGQPAVREGAWDRLRDLLDGRSHLRSLHL